MTLNRALGLLFVEVLVSLTSFASAVPTPKRAFTCQDLFSISDDEQLARAGRAAIAANPKMIHLLERDVFSTPRLIVLLGPQNSGKTFSIAEGLFPVLGFDGITTALKPIEFIFDLADATSEAPLYTEFHVLAIDNVELARLGYRHYKDLKQVIQGRYELGLSTILISHDENIILDLNELLDMPRADGFAVEALEFPKLDGLTSRH